MSNIWLILQRLKRQLEASQPKVMSLKDTADQYLVDVDSEACQSTREKINLIAKKNEELLRRCNDNLELLETTIDPSEFDISRVSEDLPCVLGGGKQYYVENFDSSGETLLRKL